MTKLIESAEIVNKLQKSALKGAKIPHGVSQPVLREEENSIYLASFIFYYTQKDIRSGRIKRPQKWILADLIKGDIIKQYDCLKRDFSDQPNDAFYNIMPDDSKNFSREYYKSLFCILDEVRQEIITSSKINLAKYSEYLGQLLDTIPDEYKVFYNELSKVN